MTEDQAMGEVRDPQNEEAIRHAFVEEITQHMGDTLNPIIDEATDLGDLTAVAKPSVPFPYDVDASHPLDALEQDVEVVKTTATGYSVQRPNVFTDGNPIAPEDVLAVLPVGTRLVIGQEGLARVMLQIPRGEVPLVTFATSLHRAVWQVWTFVGVS